MDLQGESCQQHAQVISTTTGSAMVRTWQPCSPHGERPVAISTVTVRPTELILQLFSVVGALARSEIGLLVSSVISSPRSCDRGLFFGQLVNG